MCGLEKYINSFYKKNSEYKDCNRARGLERYYDNKIEKSNQQELYYEKDTKEELLQEKNNRCKQIKELVISYVELENKLKKTGRKIKYETSKITCKNVYMHNYIDSYDCMYTKVYLYVYTTTNTYKIICIQNYKYSYEGMFTQ